MYLQMSLKITTPDWNQCPKRKILDNFPFVVVAALLVAAGRISCTAQPETPPLRAVDSQGSPVSPVSPPIRQVTAPIITPAATSVSLPPPETPPTPLPEVQKKHPNTKQPEKAPDKGAGSPKEPPPEDKLGAVSLNSVPPSNVVIDGKPMGKTPLLHLPMAPGKHTIVFIHPDLGKRTQDITIKSGSISTAAVRF
jgi:hypothetical protein